MVPAVFVAVYRFRYHHCYRVHVIVIVAIILFAISAVFA